MHDGPGRPDRHGGAPPRYERREDGADSPAVHPARGAREEDARAGPPGLGAGDDAGIARIEADVVTLLEVLDPAREGSARDEQGGDVGIRGRVARLLASVTGQRGRERETAGLVGEVGHTNGNDA